MSITRRKFMGNAFLGIGVASLSGRFGSTVLAEEARQQGLEIGDIRCLSSRFEELPAMACDSNGKAWMVSLDWQVGGEQNIAFYSFDGAWKKSCFVAEKAGSYETPVIACCEGGKPMVVWSNENGDSWTLEAAVYDGKSFSYQCAVDDGGRAANPALAAGIDGDYWLVWESYNEGVFEICLRHFKDGKWHKPVAVSAGGNSYDPAVAISPEGKVWVAYTQADGAHRSVKLTSYDAVADKLTAAIDVAVGGEAKGKPNINAHPAIAFDSESRLWISWEAREVSKTEKRTETTCYYGTRCCPVVCYIDGKIQKIAGTDVKVFKGANDHHPVFMKDGSSKLWLFTRNSEEIRKWHIRASSLGSQGWSPPFALIENINRGRGDKVAVSPGPGNSLHIGWQADNFKLEKDWFEVLIKNLESQMCVATLSLPSSMGDIENFEFEPQVLVGYNDKSISRRWESPRKVDVNGQAYTLLFGNLHEHTNFSRCWSDGSDGDLEENYRYGLDVEGYDFIALTDHGYDLNEPRWRKSRRAVRFYNNPQRLVALPAFEWTLSGPDRPLGGGHRNLIFKSDADAAKWVNDSGTIYDMHHAKSNRIDRVWELLKEKDCDAVTIPHHPADQQHPMCWEHINHDYQMVVEIFQCRRSAEYRGCPDHTYNPTKLGGSYVQDALAKGHKLGFVSGGDHNAMGTGVTALFVKEVSQAGVMEAMTSRRCYGTSGDKIFVDFRINDAFMGQELVVDGELKVNARIEAVMPLKSVVLFKNNEIVWEKKPKELNKAKNLDVKFTDKQFNNDSYYYLRAIQEDEQIVWSSPIWCTKSIV